MSVVAVVLALALIGFVLWEGFETMVLPRQVDRRLRLTGFFYRCTWPAWAAWARRLPGRGRREHHLSFYGPLSLIMLMGVWAAALVFGFALLHWGLSSDLAAPEGVPGFGAIAYHSGVTLFTLGFGDVTPRDPLGRAVAVLEAGTGLAFLAVIIGHLPVLYQAFSRREVSISLLDARAGSPPSGVELLCRSAEDGDAAEDLHDLLRDWERWSAELLENQLSYPLLGYFRSHHDQQSWVAALTAILDLSALLLAVVDGAPRRPARLMFAMARQAATDLAQVFGQAPAAPEPARLPRAELARLRLALASAGVPLREGAEVDARLVKLRQNYEPYVNALASYLLMPLPPWVPASRAADHRETSARGPA